MEIVRSGASISWPAPDGKVCGLAGNGPRSSELVSAGWFAAVDATTSPHAAHTAPASQNLATTAFSGMPAN
jgi:hypothetical protein